MCLGVVGSVSMCEEHVVVLWIHLHGADHHLRSKQANINVDDNSQMASDGEMDDVPDLEESDSEESEGMEASVSDDSVEQLCNQVEDCDKDYGEVTSIIMTECNEHFANIQKEYEKRLAQLGSADTEAVDDWYIDECIEVFTGMMAGANANMDNEVVLKRIKQLYAPFLENGYLNDELLFEYMNLIYAGVRDSRVEADLETKYVKGGTDEVLDWSGGSADEDYEEP